MKYDDDVYFDVLFYYYNRKIILHVKNPYNKVVKKMHINFLFYICTTPNQFLFYTTYVE